MKVIPSFTHSDSRRLPLMVAVIVVVLTMLACGGTNTGNTADSSVTDTPAGPTPTIDLSFTETFDSLGGWASEASKEVSGNVTDGVYIFNLIEPDSFYWSTADRLVGSGTYEISATAVSGPLNNGFGMMINVDNNTDSFIALEISSDGYASVYTCENACETYTPIVSDGWFETPAVRQELNNTNILKIKAASFGTSEFYVNDQLIGQADMQDLILGDIAVFVESFEEGNVVVHFDNFKFTP